jgi:hypothetical protein
MAFGRCRRRGRVPQWNTFKVSVPLLRLGLARDALADQHRRRRTSRRTLTKGRRG